MIVSSDKTRLLKWLFIIIFLMAPIKNSSFFYDTIFGLLISILQSTCLLIIGVILLINTKDKLTLPVLIFLLISILYVTSLGDGYIEVLATFILTFAFVKIGNFSFIINIAYYYLIITTFILIFHITGFYRFPSNSFNIIKGETFQLGFRNINTYGFYITQSIIIGFILKKKKILYWGITLLFTSYFYTKTRTSIVVILITTTIYLLIIKPMWISTRVKSVLVTFGVMCIFCIGYLTIIFATKIGNIDMMWLIQEDFTLDDLSSARISMLADSTEKFNMINWIFGDTQMPVQDSFYLFIITKYGFLSGLFCMFWILIRFFILMENEDYRTSIFFFSVLLYGLFEMTISPYSFMSIFFYMFLFNFKKLNNYVIK